MSLDGHKLIERVRVEGIRAMVGSNGSGKSMLAVASVMPSLARGRPVLSTVRLLDWERPRPCDDPSCESPDHGRHAAAHPLYIPWTTWGQLLELEHADALADEVTGVASSRSTGGLPVAAQNTLVQLRRRDVSFTWTSPAYARCEVILRECTQLVTVCSGHVPTRPPVVEGEEPRVWRQNRLFNWRTYDAQEMTRFEAGQRDKLSPVKRAFFWAPGKDVLNAYDTYDTVNMIGTVSESGRCENCGGRKTVPACTCGGAGDNAKARRVRPLAAGAARPVETSALHCELGVTPQRIDPASSAF